MTTPQNPPALTETTTAATRVGIYTRGDASNVAHQLAECTALAASRGWTAQHYTDGDTGAWRTPRPAFDRLMADLATGSIGGIVTYDLDRLSRRPSDIERIIDAYEQAPGQAFALVSGDLDLSTSDGRFLARMVVTVNSRVAGRA